MVIGLDRYTPWKEMMNDDLEPLNKANDRIAYAHGEFAVRSYQENIFHNWSVGEKLWRIHAVN